MTNAPPRDLPTIASDIRARTESIADVVTIGGLLLEAQDQLEHGGWLPWVERELDFTERTAQRYVSAHRFARKYDTVSDSLLTRSALYRLASGDYEPGEIEAVLAVAASERVTRDRLDEVVASIEPPPEEPPEEEATEAEQPDDDAVASDDVSDWVAEEEAARAAADAILDGPPPELPATDGAPEVDHITPAFNQAIGKLRELSTKPLSKFQSATHSADEIGAAAEFLKQLEAQARGPDPVEDDKDVEGFCQEWASSKCKQIYEQATGNQRMPMLAFITRA